MHEGFREDIELGDEEHDAFLPPAPSSLPKPRPSGIFGRLPPRLRSLLSNISRTNLIILILLATLLLIAISYGKEGFRRVEISSASSLLSKELASNLSGSMIPEYVLKYGAFFLLTSNFSKLTLQAPLVYLDKDERYFPSDLTDHVSNTIPTLNFSTIRDVPQPLDLENLNALNVFGALNVSLAASPPLTTLPSFLIGQRPDSKTLQTENAISCVIVVVEKGKGMLDVFYFYFYSFNAGPSALGHTAGNHLGDWEHNMIRFQNESPVALWYSQHSYGAAYTYNAVRKIGSRPVVFSAKGSHANYAVYGSHDMHEFDERVPAHLVYDRTSQGFLWDPTLSAYYYSYDKSTGIFKQAIDSMPDDYLYYLGLWGDDQYPDEMEGQENFQGFRKWTDGPTGPLYKHLDREEVCPPTEEQVCVVQESF